MKHLAPLFTAVRSAAGHIWTAVLGVLLFLGLAAPSQAQCNPTRLHFSQFHPSGSVGEIAVRNGVAYVHEADTHPGDIKVLIFDVSNPLSPQRVGDLGVYVGGPLWLSGSRLYTGPADAGVPALRVFDVSTPASPQLLGSTSASFHNMVVSGDIAYTSYTNRITLFDVANPAAMFQRTSLILPGWQIESLAIQGNLLFAVNDAGLHVVNVANPAAPVRLNGGGVVGGYGLAVEGNYAYVTNFGGLYVVDISNPAAPRLVASREGRGFYEVVVSGGRAYGKWVNSVGMTVYDISTPTNPIQLWAGLPPGIPGNWAAGSNGRIAVVDGKAYTTTHQAWAIWDVQSCANTPPTANAGADFSVNEGQAFVTLNGSGSSDPDNDPLTYLWEQTSGTAVTLSASNAVQPTFTAPLVGIGGEVLGFRLTVTANGESATDTVAVTILNLNQTPVVTITAPADGIVTGGATVAVSANVVDEDATTITSTPAGLTPATLLASGGTVSGPLALSEGPNNVIVSALDAGGLSAATSIVVYRDSVAPLIAISPAEGTVVSTPIPSFGITVTDQTETDVLIDGDFAGSALVPDGDTYGVATALLTGSIPLWTEGANTIVVQATDAAGNTTTVTRTVILDSTAPVVEITSPANGACFGVGSDADIPLVATVNDATATVVSGALEGSLAAGGGTLTGVYTLVEGVNQISVSVQDNGGAGLAATDTVSVTLDTIAPTVAITTPADQACVRGTIEVHTTASDVLPGAVASSTVFVDGIALAPNALYVVDTTLLADGWHELRVDATDTCGNASSATIQVDVDNTAPQVTLSNPFDLDWVSGTIGFDATASDAGSGLVSVTMRAAGNAPSMDGSQVWTMPVGSAFSSSQVDTALALGGLDGDLELEVTAIDCAGNATTVAITVHVDNTAPSKTILAPADGSEVRCSVKVEADASDLNLASVQFVIDGVAGPLLYAAPFEAVVDTRTRLDGDMEITLIATDFVGNVSTCTIHVTVDNLEVKIEPSKLELKSRGHDKSVTAKVEGQSANLLMGLNPSQITLCVPGGSPIPATHVFGFSNGWRCHDEHRGWHRGHRKWHKHGCQGAESSVKVKFDRQLLIGALRGAGITRGNVELTIKATIDGEVFELGTDTVRVEK